MYEFGEAGIPTPEAATKSPTPEPAATASAGEGAVNGVAVGSGIGTGWLESDRLERDRLETDWSRLRDRFGPGAVAVVLVVVTGLMLTLGVKLYLVAIGTMAQPTVATAAVSKLPASGPNATVAIHATGASLPERAGPSTINPVRGHIADGATIGVICQVFGETVTGPATTSPWWEIDSHGLYVADADITWPSTRPTMPWCGVTNHRAVTAAAHVGYDGLSLRSGPATTGRKLGTDVNGAVLTVACQVWGQAVDGVEGNTATWSKLATGEYVSDAFVHWSPEQPIIPWCGEAPRTIPPATAKAFIKAAVAPARASATRYGVPASVTIAQAILESGSGVSTLTQIDHNLFGMKCFGSPGPVAVGCRSYATHECSPNDSCYATGATFRAYRTAADSYADHGILLSATPRYKPILAYANDPDKFAKALQKAGYATSPKYAANLISVMKHYNLYQYDVPAKKTCTHAKAAADVLADNPVC